jgi:hypothetical protein
MKDKIRILCARVKIRSPRPIHAQRPALNFAAHLRLRGHSAIKLTAGNNPGVTTSIFAMPTAPALGRSLTAIGSAKLLSYRFIRKLAYFISLGTNCFRIHLA